MKILLTGSNGFVGSHIAEHLVERGHEVVCLVRKTSDLRWLNGLNVEYRYGDVTDFPRLPELVRSVDAVIHNAGTLRALLPETYYRVNQEATRRLAEAAAAANPGLKSFIFISSQAAMGPSTSRSPKSLDEPESPVSDYGRSKLAGEKELKAMSPAFPWTILRPASVYGPRDKDIFIFFSLVHRRLRPAPLSQRYIQLVFVRDLARAAEKALTDPKARNRVFVVADEQPYSWDDVGKTIARSVGRTTLPLPLPDAAFHVTAAVAETFSRLNNRPAVLNRQKAAEMLQRFWLADCTPARCELGLDFTKLEIGAKITYLWYKENHWF